VLVDAIDDHTPTTGRREERRPQETAGTGASGRYIVERARGRDEDSPTLAARLGGYDHVIHGLKEYDECRGSKIQRPPTRAAQPAVGHATR